MIRIDQRAQRDDFWCSKSPSGAAMTVEKPIVSGERLGEVKEQGIGAEDWQGLTSPRALFKTRFKELFIGEVAVRLGQSDLGTCFVAALVAQGWIGSARHLAEALPAGKTPLDITDVRNAFATLGYRTDISDFDLSELSPLDEKSIVMVDDEPAFVVLECGADSIVGFDYETQNLVECPKPSGTARVITVELHDPDEDNDRLEPDRWFRSKLSRFEGLLAQAFVLSFLINGLGLATPLYVMFVYDRVITTESFSTLGYLSLGIGLAFGFDFLFRRIRSKTLGYAGARMSYIVGNAIFERLLGLPSRLTERAGIGAQVARIKDLERVRDIFNGPVGQAALDIPFATLFVIAIAIIGGSLAIVPIAIGAFYIIGGIVFVRVVRVNVNRAAQHSSKRQELMLETVNKMRAIKASGAEEVWRERFAQLSAKAARSNFQNAQTAALVITISHSMTIIAGLATLGIGIDKVVAGTLTTGGLIATMMMVWRVLAPLQSAFVSMTRIGQVGSSIRQINRLMGVRPERDPRQVLEPIEGIQGHVEFSNVTLRYGADTDPALINISFAAEPGEVIAIIGPNGCGKSTVLKVLSGLYKPQGGSIRIDGHDVRQMDPIELRHVIGYVPQVPQMFDGTIADNLRLALPTATDEELLEVIERTGATEQLERLPEGLDTPISTRELEKLPASLLVRLSLARAYLKAPPIVLMDEPVTGLDFEGEYLFTSAVEELKKTSTVLVVTHRPSHMKLADKILMLERGASKYFGPAAKVVDTFFAQPQK